MAEALSIDARSIKNSPNSEPIQKKPVNDTGRVSVNRALELSKGTDETIKKSINLGNPLDEKFVKLSDSPVKFTDSNNNRSTSQEDIKERKLAKYELIKRQRLGTRAISVHCLRAFIIENVDELFGQPKFIPENKIL